MYTAKMERLVRLMLRLASKWDICHNIVKSFWRSQRLQRLIGKKRKEEKKKPTTHTTSRNSAMKWLKIEYEKKLITIIRYICLPCIHLCVHTYVLCCQHIKLQLHRNTHTQCIRNNNNSDDDDKKAAIHFYFSFHFNQWAY